MPRYSARRYTRSISQGAYYSGYGYHRKRSRPSRTKKGLKPELIVRVALVAIVFVVSTAILVGAFFYQNLSKSFISASSFDSRDLSGRRFEKVLFLSTGSFDDELLRVHKMLYMVLDKKLKKVTTFELAQDVVVDIPGKYGEEELTKSVALGSMCRECTQADGYKLAMQSVSKLFGLGADRFIAASGETGSRLADFFEGRNFGGLLDTRLFLHLSSYLRTDFTPSEFYELHTFLLGLPEDRYIVRTVEKSDVEQDKIDEWVKDITYDSSVSLENKSIAVLNGTGVQGVGSLCSRYLVNMGGRVVAISNTSEPAQKSMLISNDLASETLLEMADAFGVSEVVEKDRYVAASENEINRADITLVIGLDMLDKL